MLKELVYKMNNPQIEAALRFCETCDDDEGYDVPRVMMKQLEGLGLVVDKKFGRFEQTILLLELRDYLEESEIQKDAL